MLCVIGSKRSREGAPCRACEARGAASGSREGAPCRACEARGPTGIWRNLSISRKAGLTVEE
ncbi:hypothetical protein NicSoilC5_05270 [Arthrobacter sp. NicSoilC5]|nr:hypothetical protein NicSoilC5_05270 [Arthrobacter sp. NicSoilC5]